MILKLLVLIAGMAVLIGMVPAFQGVFISLGLDGSNPSDLDRTIESGPRRGEEYDRKLEVLKQRMQQKDQAVLDLLAGRISFLETAAWFQHWNECSFDMGPIPLPLPGEPVERQYCRQVIQVSKAYLSKHAGLLDEAPILYMTQELAAMTAQPKRIQLPPVGE